MSMSRRANPNFRKDPREDAKPETVLVIQSSVEDPLLNGPDAREPVKKPNIPMIPRATDPANETPLPDWMGAAIASDAELRLTDDPALVGTLVTEGEGDSPPPSPVQSALDDLDTTRLEKKELLARANYMSASLKEERDFYRQQRARRAILVPELPSNRKLYPEDARVSYAPYTVQDLEDINNNDIPLYQKYLIMLEGIYTVGMTPLELTFADFTFICDTRHIQALEDAIFRYPYICSACGQTGTHQFNLTEVGFAFLKREMPLHVRFHSFPDEIFVFVPHTIGDVLHLMKSDQYWRKMGEDYVVSEDGKRILDRVAVNACRCISHPWVDAYYKIMQASENPADRNILTEIGRMLYHGSEPIKFKCDIPLDKNLRGKMAETTANLVNGLVSGELSTITPNEESQPSKTIPPWMQVHRQEEEGAEPRTRIKVCGAPNEIDVVAGDIIIPFRRSTINMEYGILGS